MEEKRSVISYGKTRQTHAFGWNCPRNVWCRIRTDSRLAPSQWETSLQGNAVSHWLGANLESALRMVDLTTWSWGAEVNFNKTSDESEKSSEDTVIRNSSCQFDYISIHKYNNVWCFFHNSQKKSVTSFTHVMLNFLVRNIMTYLHSQIINSHCVHLIHPGYYSFSTVTSRVKQDHKMIYFSQWKFPLQLDNVDNVTTSKDPGGHKDHRNQHKMSLENVRQKKKKKQLLCIPVYFKTHPDDQKNKEVNP